MNIPNPQEWLMMEEFDKLFYLQNILSEQEYVNVVKDWYTQTEIVYQNLQLWIDTFKSIKNTKLLMDYDELNYFNNLPKKIVIYRGGVSKRGISWTLNKDIAEWFANRFRAINKGGQLFEKKVYKNDCIAYFNDREEEEIIYIGDE
tara:strand:+ start:1410 stop:1847 length:438 start_codon:yes stop_codon:yes gene_type:complete